MVAILTGIINQHLFQCHCGLDPQSSNAKFLALNNLLPAKRRATGCRVKHGMTMKDIYFNFISSKNNGGGVPVSNTGQAQVGSRATNGDIIKNKKAGVLGKARNEPTAARIMAGVLGKARNEPTATKIKSRRFNNGYF